ncbi:MAG: ATP-binding protein [Phycisphaerae bacterium]
MTPETATKMRSIVHIDEDKCDGCGLCVPACAEGAIRIIDGKAKLVAENLCDGLGACLGNCPKGAITIEERPADEFDPDAVEARLKNKNLEAETEESPGGDEPLACGCPGTAMRKLSGGDEPKARPSSSGGTSSGRSRLGHWPVQLALVPQRGEMWDGADVLLCADCVAYALPDFHDRLLAGRSLAVTCPKLDDAAAYVEKLTRIFSGNDIRSVTVARMEVPCCGGLTEMARRALAAAGSDAPLWIIEIAMDGTINTALPAAKEA